MTTKRAVLAALAIAATLAGATGSAASATATTRTLWTTGSVSSLSADGSWVSVGTTRLTKLCDRVVVWNAVARRSIHWAAHTNCPGGGTSGGQALLGATLAGTRVAWLESVAGNNQDLSIYSASLVGSLKAKQAAFAENGNGAGGDPEGNYVGNLAGDGTLLAFNSWHWCDDRTGSEMPPPQPPCTLATKGVVAPALWRITSTGGKAAVRSGASSYELVAADSGRLAVLDRTGARVTILNATGGLVRTVVVKPGTHRGIALNQAQLAVLTGGTLDVYSTTTGTLVKTLALTGAAPRLTDLQSGIAVYTTGRQVHAVRISDGRNRVAATAPAALAGAPQLESAGLWYGYNLASGKTRGRVVYLPWASVLAKLR